MLRRPKMNEYEALVNVYKAVVAVNRCPGERLQVLTGIGECSGFVIKSIVKLPQIFCCFFRGSGIDIKTRAPFKTGYFGQFGHYFKMPVIMLKRL